MAIYKIGQRVFSSNSNVYGTSNKYSTNLASSNNTISTTVIKTSDDLIKYYDEGLMFTQPLESNNAYLLRASILKKTTKQQFKVYLINKNKSIDYSRQYIKTITVGESSVNSSWYQVELVFSPVQDNKYYGIYFELQRSISDFIGGITTTSDKKIASINIDKSQRRPLFIWEELSKIVNLKNSKLTKEDIIKIGIQATQGQKFCLNNELINIGKTGIYEFNTGTITINSFGIVKPNKLNKYKYNIYDTKGKIKYATSKSISYSDYKAKVKSELSKLQEKAGSSTYSQNLISTKMFNQSSFRTSVQPAFIVDYLYQE